MEVTIDPPSKEMTKAANALQTVTDARGREITIKRLGVLDRMRLYEIVGGDLVKNEAYFGYATLAFMVVSIDGDQVAKPGTKRELEAMVQRLDDEGLNAVAKGVFDSFNEQSTAEEVKTAVKNG